MQQFPTRTEEVSTSVLVRCHGMATRSWPLFMSAIVLVVVAMVGIREVRMPMTQWRVRVPVRV